MEITSWVRDGMRHNGLGIEFRKELGGSSYNDSVMVHVDVFGGIRCQNKRALGGSDRLGSGGMIERTKENIRS